MYWAANKLYLHVLQFAISIILESMLILLYVAFYPRKVVNCSVMSSCINALLLLPNMEHQNMLTLCWRSFSWWGNAYVMARAGWARAGSKVFALGAGCLSFRRLLQSEFVFLYFILFNRVHLIDFASSQGTMGRRWMLRHLAILPEGRGEGF